MWTVLTVAAAVAAAPPASAPAAPAPAAPAAVSKTAYAKPASDPNKMICKSFIPIGTRFPEKDCRTRAEWDAMASDSAAATTANQRTLGVPRQ